MASAKAANAAAPAADGDARAAKRSAACEHEDERREERPRPRGEEPALVAVDQPADAERRRRAESEDAGPGPPLRAGREKRERGGGREHRGDRRRVRRHRGQVPTRPVEAHAREVELLLRHVRRSELRPGAQRPRPRARCAELAAEEPPRRGDRKRDPEPEGEAHAERRAPQAARVERDRDARPDERRGEHLGLRQEGEPDATARRREPRVRAPVAETPRGRQRSEAEEDAVGRLVGVGGDEVVVSDEEELPEPARRHDRETRERRPDGRREAAQQVVEQREHQREERGVDEDEGAEADPEHPEDERVPVGAQRPVEPRELAEERLALEHAPGHVELAAEVDHDVRPGAPRPREEHRERAPDHGDVEPRRDLRRPRRAGGARAHSPSGPST